MTTFALSLRIWLPEKYPKKKTSSYLEENVLKFINDTRMAGAT